MYFAQFDYNEKNKGALQHLEKSHCLMANLTTDLCGPKIKFSWSHIEAK